MRHRAGARWALIAVVAGGLSFGCIVRESDEDDDEASAPPAGMTQEPAPVTQPPSPAVAPVDSLRGLRFVVDLSERELYVLRGVDTLRTEAVAVGTAEHRTPTGEWAIHRVDWNPDWTPPPGEEWTEDEEPQPPGSPENPMGLARLVFHPPYTIHGTKKLESLGKASSHGSIRVANEAVVELGRLVMDAGGASRPESFFQQVGANRTRMVQVDIPAPIPITIQP